MTSLALIIMVDVVDVWRIDFVGPFCNSFGNTYILLYVSDVSKWVETIPTRTNETRLVIRFLKRTCLPIMGYLMLS